MTNQALLRRLAEVHTTDNGTLSVYVDLDPSMFPTISDRQTEVDVLVQEAEDRFVDDALEHDEKEQRTAAVKRLREVLNDPDIAKGKTRSIAVFAAPAEDVFEVLRLPDPVPPTVVIDDAPYIRPLADGAGPKTWAILLADSRHGRVLYGGQSRLTEVTRIDDESVPAHTQVGGWSQSRYQRHADDAKREHLDDALQTLLDFFGRTQFDALAIAAPDPTYDEIVDRLHPYLKERLQGRIHIEIDYPSPHEVLEHATEVFDSARTAAIDDILDRIQESARELVTIGPDMTLQALSEQRVDTLVLSEQFSAKGVRCPSCGWVGLQAQPCPFDQSETEQHDDVVADAFELALTQSAKVVTISPDEDRQPPEPMCALLRY